MKLETLKPEHIKVLTRIQNSIPREWLNNVTHTVKEDTVILDIVEKGLADPEVSEEVKAKLRLVKESGYATPEREVENTKITKLIDDYVKKEIKKAIARGELPKKAKEANKNISRIIKVKNAKSKKDN